MFVKGQRLKKTFVEAAQTVIIVVYIAFVYFILFTRMLWKKW